MDSSRTEAWLQCTCEGKNMEELLLRLRMLCEEQLTHMFYYEEEELVPVVAARNFLSGAVIKRAAARETHSYTWHLRKEVNESIYSSGRDRPSRPFNQCQALAHSPNKQWCCIVEHKLSRSVVASHGCHFGLRRRVMSEFSFSADSSFFELCGLRRQNDKNPKCISGRRYAHFLGITVSLFSTKDEESDSYQIEFSAIVPDPSDEVKIASRIERLADALAPLLTGPLLPASYPS